MSCGQFVGGSDWTSPQIHQNYKLFKQHKIMSETQKYEVLQAVEFPQGTAHAVGAILDLTAQEAGSFAEGFLKLVVAGDAAPATDEVAKEEGAEDSAENAGKEKQFKVLQGFAYRGADVAVGTVVELKEDELAALGEGMVEAVVEEEGKTPTPPVVGGEGSELEKKDEVAEPVKKVGTAVVNSEGLVKTVFTEDEHGKDHAEKAAEYASQGGFQTQPWEG